MAEVAVVGAGVCGLHLALRVQQREVPVTVYAERPPDEMRAGPRSMNTAGQWVPTRERERELGVNHWDDAFPRVATLNVVLGGGLPLRFSADLGKGPIAVDYRVQMPRMLEDFIERGGEGAYGSVVRESLDEMSERHDLVVISSGRGTMTELFPKIRRDVGPLDRDRRQPSHRPEPGLVRPAR